MSVDEDGLRSRRTDESDVSREDARAAAKALMAMSFKAFGTFNESPVAAVWHDGSIHPIAFWGEFERAVIDLAAHHGLFEVLMPEDDH